MVVSVVSELTADGSDEPGGEESEAASPSEGTLVGERLRLMGGGAASSSLMSSNSVAVGLGTECCGGMTPAREPQK